ncbi:Protein-glutamate methylesterase/protein-glutamine glutaminase [Dyadobacter sp. CECT 9275]|uniref:Protein-glutamate methylesterase/protein-glutamine glutaminase n=1 Tax=Dyadobacter helix TaxID=2822344 RepID=A0A916JG52_9BACT|nr:response regulator [Dyadobacter sp. CECT 9275]CAG5007792.1 Protein-glutamate methylesterase/protein-glutamine glutaminase [Dyadobacter sp. CECT 9275]
MNPLKILIVEDEVITAMDIQETLERADHQVTGIAQSYYEAMESVRRQVPDMALLDIRLQEGEDGIRLAKDITERYDMPIIFLTAHSEHDTFAKAKETAPAAYLLKPFRQKELALQIELAYHHFKLNKAAMPKSTTMEYLFLPINKGYEKIAKSDVLFMQAEGVYVKIFMLNESKPHLLSMNLGYLSQYFNDINFYRLSRSLLVNLSHLERIEKNHIYLRGFASPVVVPETNRADLLKHLTVVRTR